MEGKINTKNKNATNDTVYEYIRTCISMPPRVNSATPWLRMDDSEMFPVNSLPVLQLQICVIFFGTLFFQTILCRLGIPRFTSMCIVGILLATTFTHTWSTIVERLFFYDSQETLGLLSVFGYMFFMFYTGVKTDMTMILRTRRSATNMGTIAVLAPFTSGMFVLNLYSSKHLQPSQTGMLGIIISVISFTTFPVVSSVLSDLKILNSELGRVGQSAALFCEMLNMFLTSIMQFATLASRHGLNRALIGLAATICLILLIFFVIRPAMFWIIRQTPEGSNVNDHYVYCILTMVLFASYATNRFGFYGILGPFILGLAVPAGPPLGTAVIKKIDTFANGVLMPVFVTTCSMRVSLRDFMDWRDKNGGGGIDNYMVQTLVIIVVTSVVKFAVCMVISIMRELPLNDAVSLSLIMCSKGIVEMAACSLTRDVLGIPDNVYSLLMMYIILNATVIPMFLRGLYDPMRKYAGYSNRNIINLKNNAELRVLTVIHRSDNIPPTINLLEATYPSKDQPLCAYVLQLRELIGRASPVFICHELQKKKKADSKSSVAEKLLDAFKNFEREFKGALSVIAFTAFSPPDMMYDDICSLALDKFTSLIVLPFHRKWSSDGSSIDLEDESVRDLNYQVMERAPCSVGVLIERVQMTHVFSPETPYNVCVLFIGGKDDREGLFFAKRMTKNPHVMLTVVRFLTPNMDMEEWKTEVDTKLLEDIKMKSKVGDSRVRYIEEIVNDGPETALVIRSLVSEFDLIIVGRQAGVETPQTCGLLQWTEYPELGVLGDLLVSTDAAGKASVFVVQQQRKAMEEWRWKRVNNTTTME